MPNLTKQEMQKMIDDAVAKAREEGRQRAEQQPIEAYKATERRLYALPDLKDKVGADKGHLEELQDDGIFAAKQRSHDIVRFQRSGRTLTTQEIVDSIIQDLKAKIAADQYEIDTVENALESVSCDPYYLAVKGRYILGVCDEEIAEEIGIDERAVRRYRGRLVKKIAIRLYGVNAI